MHFRRSHMAASAAAIASLLGAGLVQGDSITTTDITTLDMSSADSIQGIVPVVPSGFYEGLTNGARFTDATSPTGPTDTIIPAADGTTATITYNLGGGSIAASHRELSSFTVYTSAGDSFRQGFSGSISVSANGLTYTQVSATLAPVSASSGYIKNVFTFDPGTVTNFSFIRLNSSGSSTGAQSRFVETDATVNAISGSPYHVDPNLLNNTSNTTPTDQPAGLVNFTSATNPYGGSDDPKEAFGKNTGPIEPGTFIFNDGSPTGTQDHLTFGTVSSVTLAGIELTGGAAGPDVGDPRRISNVELTYDSNHDGVIDAGDTTLHLDDNFPDTGDGGTGVADYIFPSSITSDLFQLTVGQQDGNGPRITEIDAIVPEPASLALAGFSAVGLLVRRRRI